jgi:uncharacterized protein YjgD (DUF1641 family)
MTTATRSEVDELLARTAELTERVDTLIALHEDERRARESLRDFQADLGLVGSVAMERSIEWLDERRIDMAAVVELLAGLAQAAPQLEKSIGTLVSVGELAGEVGDVGGVVFESAIEKLDDLGRRGYFTFLVGLAGVLDRIVTSFGEDDLDQLGDNVVLILQTIKEMTQPEVMRMLQRTVKVVRDDEPKKLSVFGLLRELRDPEVKLGMYRAITLLRGLAGTDAAEIQGEGEEART